MMCALQALYMQQMRVQRRKSCREAQQVPEGENAVIAPEARWEFRRIGMETQRGEIPLADAGGL